jgi:hypothetical protein
MDIRFVHPDLIFTVAGIADFIPFFLEQKFWNQPMPQMALFTFRLLHGRMDLFHREVFL